MELMRKNSFLLFLILVCGSRFTLAQSYPYEVGCTDVGQFECDCPGCQAFLEGMQNGTAEDVSVPYELGQPQPVPMSDGLSAPPNPSLSMDNVATSPSDIVGDFSNDFNLSSSLAAGSGATFASNGVPSMIGDFFGGGYNYTVDGPFNGGTVTLAGGDRRMKFSENNSPFPRDRIFFNYNHFHNALTDPNGNSRDLNRYTFGVESTILNEFNSVELRVPFAGTLASREVVGRDLDSTEFGNIALAFKRMLYHNECTALAAGMAVVLPTGRDSSVIRDSQTHIIFNNDAVHIQPFIGLYRKHSQRVFWQLFSQLDFDANGNRVVIPNGSIFQTVGANVNRATTLQDQTLLMLDFSLGYWLHQDRCARLVTGVAPMIELHYTTTLDDQETIPGVFESINRRDILNLTGGLFIQLGNQSSIKVGAVSPLRTGFDKVFDTELGVQFVRGF